MPTDLPDHPREAEPGEFAASNPTQRSLRSLMVTITLFALVVLAMLPFLRQPRQARTVWIPEPTIEAPSQTPEAIERLRAAARDAIERSLAGRSNLVARPVDLPLARALEEARQRAERPPVTAGDDDAEERDDERDDERVDEIAAVAVRCAASECAVSLARLRAVDSSAVWRRPGPSVEATELLALARAIDAESTMAYLRYPALDGGPRLHVDARTYAAWIDLRRAADPDLEALAAVRRDAPRFVDPYLREAEERAERGEIEAALERLAAARRIAPDDRRPLETLAEIAAVAGREDLVDEARRALEALDG